MDQLAYTIDDARGASRVGRDELRRAVKSGELKAMRVGRRVLIPKEALEDWLRRRAGMDRVAVG